VLSVLNIPNLGRNIPNMGRNGTQETSLADALLTRGRQRVLGILFSQPDESFPATELIARAGVGTGAVHRELARLAESGIVTMTPVGRQRRYQANRESPIFDELHGLVLKTVGLAEPLRGALTSVDGQIRLAFVYGSVAKGRDTARSDIDLLVVADDVSYSELYAALSEAEHTLVRPINPTIMTSTEWRQRTEAHDHFVESICKEPRLFLLGGDDDLV
jgi:predicted nucleotidyltransferase/DNA-binding MarR family transcriptional regulator